jgi:trigger factor
MEAMIELEPVFELSDYSALDLEKPKTVVTDQEITNFLERMRENRGESVRMEIDRGLKEDDIAVIDFTGAKGGKALEELDGKDYLVRIGRSELVGGFEEQILGMKSGETREFDLTFPDDFVNKDLSGQLIHFTVALKEIRELQLPELDDEFARSFGKFDTLDALKATIREDIFKTKEDDALKTLKGNLARRLVEDNVFDVPPTLVDRELRHLVKGYGENLLQAGMSNERVREMILTNEDNLKKSAAEQIRLLYIIGEIAEKEGVNAKAEEIRAVVQKRAQRSGRDTEELMNEYAGNGTLADIGFNITREKVFEMLLEKAKITEVKAEAGKQGKKNKPEDKSKKKKGKK